MAAGRVSKNGISVESAHPTVSFGLYLLELSRPVCPGRLQGRDNDARSRFNKTELATNGRLSPGY